MIARVIHYGLGVSVRFSDSQVKRLDELAAEAGTNRSEVLRGLVDASMPRAEGHYSIDRLCDLLENGDPRVAEAMAQVEAEQRQQVQGAQSAG